MPKSKTAALKASVLGTRKITDALIWPVKPSPAKSTGVAHATVKVCSTAVVK